MTLGAMREISALARWWACESRVTNEVAANAHKERDEYKYELRILLRRCIQVLTKT